MKTLKDILKKELNHLDESNLDLLNDINQRLSENNRRGYVFLVGSNLYKKGQDMDLVVDSVDTKKIVSKVGDNYKNIPLHISISDIGLGRINCPIYLNFKYNEIKGNFEINYK